MPDSFEIVLGVKGRDKVLEEIRYLLPNVLIPMNLEELKYGEDPEYSEMIACKGSEVLPPAFTGACAAVGFSPYGNGAYNTPQGVRELQGFMFDLYYDPYEIGDDPTTVAFGVRLSGRYRPVFLDWESEHGCLYHWVMDASALSLMQLAKTHISAVYPRALDWNFIFQSVHY